MPTEISATYPITYPDYFPKVEYDTRVIKSTIRIGDNEQQEVVYTYDKYGMLISSVINAKTIAEV